MKKAQRISIHIIFWTIILFWRANGDYFSKVPFEKFVWHNLLRLPLAMIATYTVIYYLLPEFIIKKKQYFKFGVLLGILLFVITLLEKLLIVSP